MKPADLSQQRLEAFSNNLPVFHKWNDRAIAIVFLEFFILGEDKDLHERLSAAVAILRQHRPQTKLGFFRARCLEALRGMDPNLRNFFVQEFLGGPRIFEGDLPPVPDKWQKVLAEVWKGK